MMAGCLQEFILAVKLKFDLVPFTTFIKKREIPYLKNNKYQDFTK